MPYDSLINRSKVEALMPEDVSKDILQTLPENSAIMSLGRKGQNMSRKQRRVPVLSTFPTAYFVNGDTGLKQTTEMEWGNIYFNAEELAVIVPIPEAVLDDTDYDVWGEVKPRAVEALGLAFDQAVLYGINAPAAWPTNILQAATNAGHVVTLGTGVDLYDDLLGENGVISLIENDGFMANGHIAAMGMRGKYRALRDANGNPIFKNSMQGVDKYELDGSPIYFPRNGSIDAARALQISGDFSKLVYTMRQDITYKVLDQAVIQDNAGNIVYNLAQQDMVALRVVMRIAWQMLNPINRLNPVEATRYPISILTA